MSHYTVLSKYGNCTLLLKINKIKSLVFTDKFALVGYEMIIANSALQASLAIHHLVRALVE